MRYLVPLPLLVLALVASSTPGQPGAGARTFPSPGLMMYGGLYLGDEKLHKELKLTPEQAKKATALASNMLTRTFGARTDAKKRDELNDQIGKEIAGILDARQMQRYREILLQQMQHIPVGSTILANEKAVVEQLKLTPEQVKRLQARETLGAVLSSEQQKLWTTMRGPVFEGRLAITGLGGGFATRLAIPTVIQYLEQNPVRIDLRLTPEQQKAMEALKQKWTADISAATRSRDADVKRAAEAEKAARAILDAGQNRRLDQIILQQTMTNGRQNTVYTNPQVVAALKLDDKQVEKIRDIQAARQKNLLPVFLLDQEVAEIVKKVNEHKKETGEQLKAVLTAEQQKQLAGLIGEPFSGEIRLGVLGGRGVATITTPLYLYVTGLRYAGSPDLHKELKLTREQIDKLAPLQDRARRIPPFGLEDAEVRKRTKEQAATLKKEVAAILTPKQVGRFEQLILQQLGSQTPSRLASLPRIVEVSEGLKLTADQKAKMQAGTTLEKVLDAKQMARWKEMLGERFQGRLTVGTSGRTGGPGISPAGQSLMVRAVKTKAVEEELRLTQKQKKDIVELEKKWQERQVTRTTFDNIQEYLEARRKATADLEKDCKKFLDANQGKRLDEILLQHQNRSGLDTLLRNVVVKAALGIEEKQDRRLEELRREHSDLESLFLREVNRPRTIAASGRGTEDKEVTETRGKISKAYQKRVEEVLTPAQMQALKRLLGQPFSGTIDSPNRFGGGAGFPG